MKYLSIGTFILAKSKKKTKIGEVLNAWGKQFKGIPEVKQMYYWKYTKKSLVNFGGSPRAVWPYRAVYPTNSLYSMEGLYGPRGSQGHLGVVYGVGVGASYGKHAMQL